MLPNFGIPAADASASQLLAGVQANEESLAQVANAAGQALQAATKQTGANLSAVAGTITRSLSGRTGANTRALNNVTQTAGPVPPEATQTPATAVSNPLFAQPIPTGAASGVLTGTETTAGCGIDINTTNLNFTADPAGNHTLPVTWGPNADAPQQITVNGVLCNLVQGGIANAIGGNVAAIYQQTSGYGNWTVLPCLPTSPLPAPSPPPSSPPAPLPPPPPVVGSSPPPSPPPPPPPPPECPPQQCIPICPSPQAPPPAPQPTKPPASSPPATTIPPPLPVVGVPPVQPGTFDLVIPLPGTPEWCNASVALNNWLAGIGQVILDNADSQAQQAQQFFLDLAQPPQDQEWSVFGTIFTGIMRDVVAPIANLAANILQQWRNLVAALRNNIVWNDTDRTPFVIGLLAVKTLWGAVKNLELGTDAAVWLISKIGEAFPEIDRVLEYLTNQIMPLEVPSPPEAMEAFLNGQIDESTYNCWLLIHGANPSTYAPILIARRDRLTTVETIQYARRAGISTEDTTKLLRNIGWLNSAEASARMVLYDELPSVADHLHWLARNVDDLDYVKQYGLLDGFSSDAFINTLFPGLQYTTHSNPFNRDFWSSFGTDLYAQGMKPEYAARHYAAHWINPAPTQMREFLYRLRPDKAGVTHPFTMTDFVRLMAEQDIAPRAAEWFADTVYHVPALSYIRDMYRQYLITDEDLVGYHQDLGYTLQDSERFLGVDKIMRDRMRATQAHGWNPAAIAGAYSIRKMDEATVVQLMEGLGYDRAEAQELMERADVELERSVFMRARSRSFTSAISEVNQAIKIGVLSPEQAADQLTAAGWPRQYAVQLADTARLQAQNSMVGQVVAAVRKAFLRGEVDAAGAGEILSQAGIMPQAVANYLTLWALQQTPQRKRRTASQIVNDVANGWITTEDALVRLANLGYDDADRMLYLADANAKIAKRQAVMIANSQRADKVAQAALAREAKAAQAQARAAIKRLEKIAPVSKLMKWAKLGIIGHDLFSARMKLYGYDPATIEDYYKEACSGKTSQCTETTPNGTTIGTGEPGIPGP